MFFHNITSSLKILVLLSTIFFIIHKIYDKELVKRVAELAIDIGSDEVIAVVGHLREQVEAVLGDSVKYAYQEELEIISQPNVYDYVPLGKGKVTHDLENGFVIEGHYNGHDYRIERPTKGLYSLHIEYDYCYLKPLDCVEISTENDSFTCYPATAKNIVTKLAFATEILYEKAMEKKKAKV